MVATGQTVLAEDIEFETSMLDIAEGRSEHPEVDLWTRSLEEAVGAFEKEYLERCLTRAGGVVSHAAKLAGIHRVTFVRKLQRYGARVEEG